MSNVRTHRTNRRPPLPFAVALSLWLGAMGSTHAQSSPDAPPAPTAPDYTRANELAAKGFDAFDRGRHAEALEHFEAAERAAHSPVFLLYMARCKRALGELDAARALYDRLLSEDLAADAPAPFRSAQDDAKAERDELDTLVPVLSVTLEGLVSSDQVALDGAPVAIPRGASSTTFRREVEAGTHVLTVTREGRIVAERQIDLKVGQTVDTSIVLPALAPSASPVPSPSPDPTATISTGPNFVPAYIVLGVAGAGAVLGAVMGGLALSRDKTAVDELESCDDSATCAQAEQSRDRALTFAHVSTTSFVVASVAAATGVVLLLTASGGDDVAVGLGPGSLHVTGTF